MRVFDAGTPATVRAPLREGALGVARRRVVLHREGADVLGVQNRARRLLEAERLRTRGGARAPRALHARARGVRERDAGDSVGILFQGFRGVHHRVGAVTSPRPSRRRAGAAAPLHLGGSAGAGETERCERQDGVDGVDGAGARLEQTEATRGFAATRSLHARDELAVARGDGRRARRARRVHPAPRRGGAALHLHRVRRGFSRGRGVEGGVVVCDSGVVEETNGGVARSRRQRKGAKRRKSPTERTDEA